MGMLSPTTHVEGTVPLRQAVTTPAQELFAKTGSTENSDMLCVPITMLCVSLSPFAVDVTLHSPASGISSVHVQSVSAVPLTVFETFIAVTDAPAEVVTTNFGVTPV